MLNDELNWTARHFPREAEGVVQGFVISNRLANLEGSANQGGLFIIKFVFLEGWGLDVTNYCCDNHRSEEWRELGDREREEERKRGGRGKRKKQRGDCVFDLILLF